MVVPVLLRKERYRDRDRDRQRARDRAWDSTVKSSALVSYKLTVFVASHQISGFIASSPVFVSCYRGMYWRCCSRARTQNSRTHVHVACNSKSFILIEFQPVFLHPSNGMKWKLKDVSVVVATRCSRTWPLVLAPSNQPTGSRPPPRCSCGTPEAEQRYRGPRQSQGCQGQIGQIWGRLEWELEFNHSIDNRFQQKFSSYFSWQDQNQIKVPSRTLSEQ